MKITRRELAVALAGGAAPFGPGEAALARAQAPTSGEADEELKTARGRVRAATESLAREEVPMSVEPAFQFKA
jgi:hypothetical protein